MLSDQEIRQALDDGLLELDPLQPDGIEGASYDFRVGKQAFVSNSDSVLDLENKGLVIIDPGEFAVITTRERVRCSAQMAGLLGLCSTYARQGLVLLSGPQIDPGFDGVLIVRVTNLAPRRVTLAFEAPFLTVQFFKLNNPVLVPYAGSRQGQTGLRSGDIEELSNPDSPTMGGMVKALSTLAKDVGELKGSVKGLVWAIPFVVTFGIAVIGVIVGLK